MIARLEAHGIAKYFESQAVSGTHGFYKPDVRLFLHACEALGVAPEECIMVGDRIDCDIVPAKQLGMRTVRLRTGRHASQEPRSEDERPAYGGDRLSRHASGDSRDAGLAAPYNGGVSNVSDLGEFGLIERLTRVLGTPKSDDLIVGIGDDAAVWRVGGEFVIATTDTMVEGVHFEIGRAPWADIGWKALATNVSDIGAMGGTPTFALVTLAIPPKVPADDVELIYAGLAECAREYGVAIVGGDTVRSPKMAITVALIGRAERHDDEPLLLRRDNARIGDIIAVTGTLGDSAAGLRRLKKDGPSEIRSSNGISCRDRLSAGRIAAEDRHHLRDRRVGRPAAGHRPHLRAFQRWRVAKSEGCSDRPRSARGISEGRA